MQYSLSFLERPSNNILTPFQRQFKAIMYERLNYIFDNKDTSILKQIR